MVGTVGITREHRERAELEERAERAKATFNCSSISFAPYDQDYSIAST